MKYLVFLWIAASLGAQVSLEGPWRMTRQDSPSFALPETADRDWAEVQLPWAVMPDNGIFWLRKTFALSTPLPEAALVLGRVAASFEVYVNGQRIGETPGFGSMNVEVWQPRQFRLSSGLAAGQVTIALRCLQSHREMGFLSFIDSSPYRLGSPAQAEAALDHFWLQSRQSIYARFILSVANVVLGIYLLLVWRRDLCWVSFFLLFWGSLWCFFSHWSSYSSHLSVDWLLLWFLFNLFGWISLCVATFQFLELPRRPLYYLIPIFAAIDIHRLLTAFLDPLGNGFVVPFGTIPVVQSVLIGLSAMRVGQGLYRIPALIVLAGNLISLAAIVGKVWNESYTFTQIDLMGFPVPVTPVAYLVLSVWMSIEYLGRLKRHRAERDRLSAEMESARAVQTSLLSINVLDCAGYHAEAVCQPALEVGGDFYELIATPNGALVVAGDVSGKGLQAAMVVALALGALRNRHASTPAELLGEMNRSLVQRKAGGFVTCTIARLEANGKITSASAGHPSPFLAGREWTLPQGLPLGLTPDASYEETTEQLALGEQLVLISDGVVEAENTRRELFGFDRTREISAKSAQEIADAARAWRQTDDITVVTVRRFS